MKFLCLAYGSEEDWNALSKSEQDTLLAQDEVLRKRGALVAAVEPTAQVLRAWSGAPSLTHGSFAEAQLPLAGFCVLDAESFEEAVRLVADTPCARAKGAIEIRAIAASNDDERRSRTS